MTGEDRALFHLHASKTGGTSVEHGLGLIFGEGWLRLTRIKNPQQMPDFPPERWRALRAISAGLRLRDFDHFVAPRLGRPTLGLFTVRDPVGRMKSLYAYLRDGAVDRTGRKRPQDHFPVYEDFETVARSMLEPARSKRVGNRQCKLLCPKRGSAQVAIDVIEQRFAAVTTTSLNRLLAAVARGAGRPVPPPIHVQRSNSAPLTLDVGLERELRAVFHEDQRLFEWVRDNEDRLLARLDG